MSDYFIHTASGQKGPYKLDELQAAGITKDSMIWREGLASWIKAGELEELKVLFLVTPPPFPGEDITPAVIPPSFPGEKPQSSGTPQPNNTGSLETIPIVRGKKSEPPEGKSPLPEINFPGKQKKPWLIILPLLAVALATAGYFYFRNDKKENKNEEEKIAVSKYDSTTHREALRDTIKKVDPDTLSNWMITDSSLIQPADSSTAKSQDFVIPGIPTTASNKHKNKDKKETVKETTKQTTQPQRQRNNTTVTTEPGKKVTVMPLVIQGSFRKNLVLEAVLEGSIRNVNNNVSFRNIVVTVNFLDGNGNILGNTQFNQPGVLNGGNVTSFKFKTRAPRGSKSAKYYATGSVF